MPAPIAEELGRVYEEHHLGRDLRRALMHMAERNPSNFELRLVVSCLLLQRQTGGNLVELLDNIAATVRARFVFDAKVRALTAEARITILVVDLPGDEADNLSHLATTVGLRYVTEQ